MLLHGKAKTPPFHFCQITDDLYFLKLEKLDSLWRAHPVSYWQGGSLYLIMSKGLTLHPIKMRGYSLQVEPAASLLIHNVRRDFCIILHAHCATTDRHHWLYHSYYADFFNFLNFPVCSTSSTSSASSVPSWCTILHTYYYQYVAASIVILSFVFIILFNN